MLNLISLNFTLTSVW